MVPSLAFLPEIRDGVLKGGKKTWRNADTRLNRLDYKEIHNQEIELGSVRLGVSPFNGFIDYSRDVSELRRDACITDAIRVIK